MSRVLDKVFFMYFLTHIPISICVDLQAVLPSWLYPSSLVALKEWYCREYRDSMMMDPPQFFVSFCLCELIFQLPFFFVASYAYYKGTAACKWIRLPVIIYSTHVITTLIAIIFHVFTTDFSKSRYPGPRTTQEKLALVSIYSPYLFVPMMLLADAFFSIRTVYDN
ncbi:sigma intracellular receptor 2-like [Gigantopelta aegis]|uniref:sigma intracellular receptor 2-like n=1 Tax=Gigantopelta aegis TaxID=1735272 RepID=UPI001B88D56A|nr:sigma intracellular receptor 2-like [Gigantopelta aegis]